MDAHRCADAEDPADEPARPTALRLTLTAGVNRSAVLDLPDLRPGTVLTLTAPDGTVVGRLDLLPAPLPVALVRHWCDDCEEELDRDGRHLAVSDGCADPVAPSALRTTLECPSCGSSDLCEVNTATVWSEILDVGMARTGGVVLCTIDSPVSGDFEGDGWICRGCSSPFALPPGVECDYG